MSNPEKLYDIWLEHRNAVRRSIITTSSAEDISSAVYKILHYWDSFLEHTRKIFDSDEKRIKERNNTISYLQDKLAEKGMKNG